MTAAAGAGSSSTNTPGLTGLTKDIGDAIKKDAGCAVSTRYPTVPYLGCNTMMLRMSSEIHLPPSCMCE